MKKSLVYIAAFLAFPGCIFAQSTGTPTVKIEDIVYKKFTAPVATIPSVPVAETTVSLGDSITVNLTSQLDPATPIDLFVLAFDSQGFPTRRIFIKTVFNEEKGVLKKYKVSINQDLLSELGNAYSMRVGYCLGGCLAKSARLIPGRVLISNSFVATSTQPYMLPTF